jgi:hypothetical protein
MQLTQPNERQKYFKSISGISLIRTSTLSASVLHHLPFPRADELLGNLDLVHNILKSENLRLVKKQNRG